MFIRDVSSPAHPLPTHPRVSMSQPSMCNTWPTTTSPLFLSFAKDISRAVGAGIITNTSALFDRAVQRYGCHSVLGTAGDCERRRHEEMSGKKRCERSCSRFALLVTGEQVFLEPRRLKIDLKALRFVRIRDGNLATGCLSQARWVGL